MVRADRGTYGNLFVGGRAGRGRQLGGGQAHEVFRDRGEALLRPAVHADHADSAVRCGDGALGRGGAVVGAFLAEPFEDVLRHAAHHDDDFSVDIDIGVVVIVLVVGGDAVTDEDQLARGPGFQLDRVGPDDHAFALGHLLAVEDEAAVLGIGPDVLHRDVGEIGAVIAGRLEAEQAHLGGDVIGSDLVSVRTGIAAGHVVGGQETDVRLDILRAHIRRESGGFGIAGAGRDVITTRARPARAGTRYFMLGLPQMRQSLQ